MTLELLLVAGAYLLGGLPTALFAVRLATGADVRETGSGNVGAVNAARAAGLKIGLFVTVVDMAKGVLPVRLMAELNPASRWLVLAGAAAVLGHCFPLWLRFRGGKGVATALGAFAALAWLPALVSLLAWAAVVARWRYAAIGSLVAVTLYPVVLALVGKPPTALLGGVSFMAVVVVIRHLGNLRNLAAGREPTVDDRDLAP